MKDKKRLKTGLTINEHKVLGCIIKQNTEAALKLYLDLVRLYPLNHKIVRKADAYYKSLNRLRSVLDDDICSYQEISDATSYYYP